MSVSWTKVWQGSQKVNVGEGYYLWDASQMQYKKSFSISSGEDAGDYDTSGYMSVANPSTDMSNMETFSGTSYSSTGEIEGFTYTGGEFDPTGDEFRKAMESGKQSDLLQGFNIGSEYYKYFEDVDMDELDFLKQEKALADKTATQEFDFGESALAFGANQNLMDIRKQTTTAQATSGFASNTAIDTVGQQATKSIMGEYNLQKGTLQQSLDTTMEKSNLAFEKGKEAFWEGTEDEWYDTLDRVETEIDADNETSGGSCFTGESPVLMSDGTKKKIKDIVKGDKIKGWGDKIHTVVELRPEKLANRKLYGFNGSPAFFTEEHPLMTIDGWKSLNPKETKRENPMMDIERFQVGDTVMGGKKVKDLGYIYTPILVEAIESKEDDPDTDVYNIHLSDGISFHVYNIPFHTVQSGVVVDKYAEEGLSNLSDEDKEKFVTAFSTVPGLMNATGKAFGSTFIKVFRQLGAKHGV